MPLFRSRAWESTTTSRTTCSTTSLIRRCLHTTTEWLRFRTGQGWESRSTRSTSWNAPRRGIGGAIRSGATPTDQLPSGDSTWGVGRRVEVVRIEGHSPTGPASCASSSDLNRRPAETSEKGANQGRPGAGDNPRVGASGDRRGRGAITMGDGLTVRDPTVTGGRSTPPVPFLVIAAVGAPFLVIAAVGATGPTTTAPDP